MEISEKNTKYYERVTQSVEFLKQWDKGKTVPDIAIVLGSGLSNIISNYSEMECLRYADIPGFQATQTPGHVGELRVGNVFSPLKNGKKKHRRVAFLHGRIHAYEGNDPGDVVHNIRTLIHWGVKGVILTNAAGCLNKNWHLGKIMLISDHINATGLSPIFGDYGKDFGARFVDMSACYTHSWQVQFSATAADMNEELYTGVYYGVPGPQYETPAEIRLMQTCGAQAVGMSTVLEAIAARQMGVKVAGMSCLTNYASGLTKTPLSHQEVMAMGKKFSVNMENIILNTLLKLEV